MSRSPRPNLDRSLSKFRKISSAVAQSSNELRLGDKLMGCLWVLLAHSAWEWFTLNPEVTGPQSAFLSAIVGASVGFCKFYLEHHPKKGEPPNQ